jgi:hypothetical protein
MPLGAYAPLPLRLGGSATEGVTAAQHARLCADLVAVKRVQPLAVWTYNKSGGAITIESFHAMHGVGVQFGPDTLTSLGDGDVSMRFTAMSFTDAYGIVHPINIRHAIAVPHANIGVYASVELITFIMRIRTRRDDGVLVDARTTVRIW